MPGRSRTREQQTAALMRKATKLAKLLGHGYHVIGVDPGMLLTSDKFPRYPLELPEEVADDIIYAFECWINGE